MNSARRLADRFARAPLAAKLVALIAVLTTVVVGATFWALSLDIRHGTRDFFVAQLDRGQRTFANLERQSVAQGLWTASLMTESPTLIAAISTYRQESALGRHPRTELLTTIQREVAGLGAGVDKALLIVTDQEGRVLAATASGAPAPSPGTDLSAVPGIRRALDPGLPTTDDNLSIVWMDGTPYHVTCVPIIMHGFPVGALALGDRLDDAFARELKATFGGDVAIVVGQRVVASTVPADGPMPETLVRQYAATVAPDSTRTLSVNGERFVAARLRLGADPTGAAGGLYLFQSVSGTLRPLNRRLRLELLGYGGIALLLASVGAAVVSRSTLASLGRFVGFVDTVADTGDLTTRFDASRVTAEIGTLNRAYDRLIGSLARQTRELEHRSAELTATNEALRAEIAERERTEDALRQSELQLRQSQKMEAMGTLAGGIAHDFNNLMSVVTGYSELVMRDAALDAGARDDLKQVLEAARRAAGLTRQLLAFSRKQVLEPRIVDLNEIVAGMEKMFRRVIGEHIGVTTQLAPGLARVRVDPGQIEQVLLNLVVNARDAMPRGGRIVIETDAVTLRPDDRERPDVLPPGTWVRLVVRDNGVGMDEATQARIFEPFFTTKGPGKGTGLGLSTVYGIVKQSGGFIFVSSEPDRGTAFTIFLPPLEGARSEVDEAETAPVRGGTETILLVEDEAPVREVAHRALASNGYRVLVAAAGPEALALAARHEGPIHLLLTDVVMPDLDGKQVADRLKADRPNVKVLFMSGYTGDVIVDRGALRPGTQLVHKPFTVDGLARRVREMLDDGSAEASAGVVHDA